MQQLKDENETGMVIVLECPHNQQLQIKKNILFGCLVNATTMSEDERCWRLWDEKLNEWMNEVVYNV